MEGEGFEQVCSEIGDDGKEDGDVVGCMEVVEEGEEDDHAGSLSDGTDSLVERVVRDVPGEEAFGVEKLKGILASEWQHGCEHADHHEN